MTLAGELAKLRALPTPRVTAAICFGLIALASLLVFALQPSDAEVYQDVPTGTAQMVTLVASIVLGAWVFGVEFGQNTLRRSLTTEPRRGVLLATKASVAVVLIAAFAVALMVFAVLLTELVASANTVDVDTGEALDLVALMAIQAPIVALMAGAFTVLFRSYAGGMIATLVMILVVDGIIGIWSAVRDYTFGAGLGSIEAAIVSDSSAPAHPLAASIVIALAWVAAIAAPGALRFIRGDVK